MKFPYLKKNLPHIFFVSLIACIALNSSYANTRNLEKHVKNLDDKIHSLEHDIDLLTQKKYYLYNDSDVKIRRSTIGTGPYFGVDSSYDGSELLINQSNINKDLGLLNQKQVIALKNSKSKEINTTPHIQISGNLEGRLLFNNIRRNNVALSSSEVELGALINNWVNGFTNFTYDSSTSDIKLTLGFLTLGNLDRSPFFLTVGRMFMPFGSFSSYLANANPLNKAIGRIRTDGIKIGYYDKNWLISAASYVGATKRHSHSKLDQYAINIQYSMPQVKSNSGFGYKALIGYTNNLAEAFRTQIVFTSPTKILRHYISGIDGSLTLYYNNFILNGEYTSALENYAISDWSENGNKVKPSSLKVEGIVKYILLGKNTYTVLHFSNTNDAAAINRGVKTQYAIDTTVNILKDTYISAEFDLQKQYKNTSFTGDLFSNAVTVLSPSSKYNKVIAVTLDIYF